MHFVLGIVILFSSGVACAAVADDDVVIEGRYLKLRVSPDAAGTVGELGLCATVGNFAGEDGLLQEGFGVGSFYVPNRRLNETLEVLDEIAERPVLRYSYDCDGPNIHGLRVTRTMEALPEEASLRVHWRIENKGDERQWVAPWVRNSVAPGGKPDANDRVDVPTFAGIVQPGQPAYYPASRNWVAATDPIERISVYGVFNADVAHSFLAGSDPETHHIDLHTAFVPRMLSPGDSWETTYRIGAVRGLKHVDFAADALAAQLDYAPGKIELLLAAAKTFRDVQIHASVLAENGRVWRLEPKRFDTDPNRVIRCTFAWMAPADGCYEFLAKLQRSDDTPVRLGSDTAPPHGGIDTHFAVGRVRAPRMKPWTDAPYALERGPRTLKRSLARARDPQMWIAPSLEKVFREDIPEPAGRIDPTVRVSLARNERESFQVVIRPPEETDLFNVDFRLSDLEDPQTGATLNAANIRPFDVGYCPVRIPSYFEGPTGNWPDALPPHKPFTARGGQCTPVWFTVHAPRGTPAGRYVGDIEMTALSAAGARLTLEVTVYDFDLPDTPALKTDFGFWPEPAIAMAKRQGCALLPHELKLLYLEDALAHRITLRELTQLPEGGADYAQDLPRQLERLAAQGVTTFCVPDSLLESPEQCKQVNALVAGKPWGKRAFCHVADEPPPPAWANVVERMRGWHEMAPDVPLMVTTCGLRPFIPEALHIWAVHTQVLDTPNHTAILSRIRDGGEVWWYVDNAPPRPYSNFFVDFTGIEHRILFWQSWALGIKGMHYWCVNYCDPERDPYAGLTDVTPVNGDGFLVYPGADGPVSSVRWEIIRDGIEDYDYLTILMDRLRRVRSAGGHEALVERAAKVCDLEELVPDLVSFARDPQILIKKRDEIGRMIGALGKALS